MCTLPNSTRQAGNKPNGGVTVSPVKPDGEYTELYRLVADEGMVLTDGTNQTACTDTDKPDAWTEIFEPESEDNKQSGE